MQENECVGKPDCETSMPFGDRCKECEMMKIMENGILTEEWMYCKHCESG
jgi:hypothetical protein